MMSAIQTMGVPIAVESACKGARLYDYVVIRNGSRQLRMGLYEIGNDIDVITWIKLLKDYLRICPKIANDEKIRYMPIKENERQWRSAVTESFFGSAFENGSLFYNDGDTRSQPAGFS